MGKYDKIADKAKIKTDNQFRDQFFNLTRLTSSDIDEIVNESGISKKDLTSILMEVKNATEFNDKTAKSINSIQNGVQALASIAKKFLF